MSDPAPPGNGPGLGSEPIRADPDAIAARVRGTLRYTFDVALEGMAHAALVRSPAPAGALVRLETSAAAALPGVLRVVTAADLASLGLADDRFGTIIPDQPILASDRVRHAGEPVAAVIADTEAAAIEAASRVVVDIAEVEPIADPDAALAPGAPLLHDGKPGNVLGRFAFANGDFADAEARTVHRFSGEYASPAAQHVTFEPQVSVARWVDGALEVWAATQSPSRIAAELARVFGLDPAAVRLRVLPLGGGYGAKNHAKLEPLAAALAALAGLPVRLANRRHEEFVTTTKHPARVRIDSGVDGEGRFTFRRAVIRWSAGAYAHSSPAVMRAGALVVCGPYRIPAADVESVMAYTNLPPAGSFRGLGANQAGWAGERQVDEIAIALGEDPLDFRRRNVIRPGDRLATGERVPDAHWLECLEAAARGIADAPAGRADRSGGGWTEAARRSGSGIALAMKHTMTPSRSEATVVATADGTLEVRSSLVDMGQGLRTVLARAAAQTLGVPESTVRVVDPDTAVTPFDATTSSSRGAWAGTTAVTQATTDLRRRLEAAGADLLEAPPEAIRLEGGRLVRTEVPSEATGLDIGAIVASAGGEIAGEGVAVNAARVDEDGAVASSSHWHQGAVAVIAEVDAETGVVAVTDAVGAAWAGRVIDAGRARLQDEGGIIFGLGPALFEELAFPDGRPASTTLLEYRIPSPLDVPERLQTYELEAGEEDAEPAGIGESLIPAVAPAIAAAIRDATGAVLRTLPLAPERVLAVLDGRPETVEAASRADRHRDEPPRFAPPVEASPQVVELVVDGLALTVTASPLTPLRDFLADRLGIRSVRAPCGVGACGACTVLVDGRAVRSCLRPLGLVAGASVVTTAGLAEDDLVSRAFVDAGAAQCGSCIPGFVLATHDLLARESALDDARIRAALAGNLCRCGTYGRIFDAVAALSAAPGSDPPSEVAAGGRRATTGRSRS